MDRLMDKQKMCYATLHIFCTLHHLNLVDVYSSHVSRLEDTMNSDEVWKIYGDPTVEYILWIRCYYDGSFHDHEWTV